jgi:putative transposase
MDKSIQEIKFIKEKDSSRSVLEEIIREGARKMLKLALENEVAEFIQKHSALVDEGGRRVVSRNGYMPERDIVTVMGPLKVKQPRVDDRRLNEYCSNGRFTSNILPGYLRRILPALIT